MSASKRPFAWITGAAGLIGQEIIRAASQYNLPWEPRAIDRSVLDLLDRKSVEKLFREEQPQLVIHAAALSRTPVCEANPDLARRTNVDVTQYLSELASEIPFIFFSSDLVFDGKKGNYLEEDEPNPLQLYGETKLAAEKILSTHPLHTILRISLTGGKSRTGDRGFNEELANAWRGGKTLNLFTDEYRCPMGAVVPAKAVWELALKESRGVYHLNGAEKMSRYQMGKLLAARHPELNPKIIPGTRKDYRGAPRPADTSLNIDKIQKCVSFPIPKFSEWLAQQPTEAF